MQALTLVALILVEIDFGLALAHALELPGKLRLNEAEYKAVQGIYYPGFTLGGLVGEFGGLIVCAVLLFLTPPGTARFEWTAVALASLAAGNLTYWVLTHPVNKFWVKDIGKSALGSGFFSTFANAKPGQWTLLRNRWEISHVIRACLFTVSLLSMSIVTANA